MASNWCTLVALLCFAYVSRGILLEASLNVGQTSTSIIVDTEANIVDVLVDCPDSIWVGMGFDATSMADTPYAIIVNADGNDVTERQLGNHAPGTVLDPSLNVTSDETSEGFRTVEFSRPLNANGFAFPTEAGDLDVIVAAGSSTTFEQHSSENRQPATLTFAEVDSDVSTTEVDEGTDVPETSEVVEPTDVADTTDIAETTDIIEPSDVADTTDITNPTDDIPDPTDVTNPTTVAGTTSASDATTTGGGDTDEDDERGMAKMGAPSSFVSLIAIVLSLFAVLV
jgi:hypothetical protein